MLLIRRFSPTDIPQITSVVKRSLGENYPPSLYLTIYNLWQDGFMVAQDDGRIVAFIAAVLSGEKAARVLMLAVHPDHRHRSLGQRLMNELYANSKGRGLDTIVLEVRKSNKNAIGFYQRQGFEIFGEIGNFYSNGEDAFKMMKVLQS